MPPEIARVRRKGEELIKAFWLLASLSGMQKKKLYHKYKKPGSWKGYQCVRP